MNRNRIIFLFICLAVSLSVFAQAPADTLLRISGKVVNAYTREMVREAEVHVSNSTASTITNEDGYFLLKCPKDAKTITFSALGYFNRAVDVSSLSTTQGLTIFLRPSATVLKDVLVLSAENIVMAAVAKIVDN